MIARGVRSHEVARQRLTFTLNITLDCSDHRLITAALSRRSSDCENDAIGPTKLTLPWGAGRQWTLRADRHAMFEPPGHFAELDSTSITVVMRTGATNSAGGASDPVVCLGHHGELFRVSRTIARTSRHRQLPCSCRTIMRARCPGRGGPARERSTVPRPTQHGADELPVHFTPSNRGNGGRDPARLVSERDRVLCQLHLHTPRGVVVVCSGVGHTVPWVVVALK